MKRALYAGSFDPFTMGHLDILRRACALFDGVTVGVLRNVEKRERFTLGERCALIRKVVEAEKLYNVEVCAHEGLTVELARERGCACILRGVRGAQDMTYELPLEAMNLRLDAQIQTVYMAASAPYAHISSSAVAELCAYGASIEGLVPTPIQINIAERLTKR